LLSATFQENFEPVDRLNDHRIREAAQMEISRAVEKADEELRIAQTKDGAEKERVLAESQQKLDERRQACKMSTSTGVGIKSLCTLYVCIVDYIYNIVLSLLHTYI
jgi:hypothetical protein